MNRSGHSEAAARDTTAALRPDRSSRLFRFEKREVKTDLNGTFSHGSRRNGRSSQIVSECPIPTPRCAAYASL
jgi:hypothetical protein